MLYYTILYYTILYYTILYYIILTYSQTVTYDRYIQGGNHFSKTNCLRHVFFKSGKSY